MWKCEWEAEWYAQPVARVRNDESIGWTEGVNLILTNVGQLVGQTMFKVGMDIAIASPTSPLIQIFLSVLDCAASQQFVRYMYHFKAVHHPVIRRSENQDLNEICKRESSQRQGRLGVRASGKEYQERVSGLVCHGARQDRGERWLKSICRTIFRYISRIFDATEV
ncbi:hypothetical protein M427DRAFT_238245 [Gonapodya prolifera JEL478]|uniref:Uncharacterized protein n=1 Tax=Gonapodya prolifera (strain JEL478) TaxID=1344416 RepID=A0A139ANF0_GONPJ|nr:hypothetical protein M427DRAFT_238245 [Gonapodya prolifera JEL478]|eukprot:KXS18053.1 hypothetical protein M427DRAFT_238245 [Gonapodya prolifera JEL478]